LKDEALKEEPAGEPPSQELTEPESED